MPSQAERLLSIDKLVERSPGNRTIEQRSMAATIDFQKFPTGTIGAGCYQLFEHWPGRHVDGGVVKSLHEKNIGLITRGKPQQGSGAIGFRIFSGSAVCGIELIACCTGLNSSAFPPDNIGKLDSAGPGAFAITPSGSVHGIQPGYQIASL